MSLDKACKAYTEVPRLTCSNDIDESCPTCQVLCQKSKRYSGTLLPAEDQTVGNIIVTTHARYLCEGPI